MELRTLCYLSNDLVLTQAMVDPAVERAIAQHKAMAAQQAAPIAQQPAPMPVVVAPAVAQDKIAAPVVELQPVVTQQELIVNHEPCVPSAPQVVDAPVVATR